MFAITGTCKGKQKKVLACELLTSKGQNGGAITFKSGQLFGIYTDIIDHPQLGDKFGMAVRVTKDIVSWIDGI